MTWKELSINPTESFSSLAFDPETPGTLYVCSYYRPLRKSNGFRPDMDGHLSP